MYLIKPNILKAMCCVFLLSTHSYDLNSMKQQDETAIEQVNIKDAAGKKQGHWVVIEKGVKKEEGRFVNNLKDGIWKGYYADDLVKHEVTFVMGKAIGEAKFYYQDGTLRESGIWKLDHWEGNYKYYFETGQLSYDWHYNEDGKREGKQIYFHSNGKKMYEGKWQDGKTEGALKVYNDQGILVHEKLYKDGQFSVIQEAKDAPKSEAAKFYGTGMHTIFNLNGQVEEKGNFVKGILMDGEKYHYNEHGEQTSITTFKNGAIVDDK